MSGDDPVDRPGGWCPGCGGLVAAAALRTLLADLRIPREQAVVVSGTGCVAHFPASVGAYGVPGVRGAALAVATGLVLARPGLSVWVVLGGDDAPAVGSHLSRAVRRDLDLTVLLLTSQGIPAGTAAVPPSRTLPLAIAAGATFVARTITADRPHLTSVLREASRHPGTAVVEVYQSCHVVDDGAFDALAAPVARSRWLRLEAGKPLRFGRERHGVVVRAPDGGLAAVEDAPDGAAVVHDPSRRDPAYAFALSLLGEDADAPMPFGILRAVPGSPRLRRGPPNRSGIPVGRIRDHVNG